MAIPHSSVNRRPIHPGAMLRDDFLPEYEMTEVGLAAAIGVSRQMVNELVRELRAVSPDMAVRLGRLFGTSSEFWLSAQRRMELWDATHRLRDELERIQPIGDGAFACAVSEGSAPRYVQTGRTSR